MPNYQHLIRKTNRQDYASLQRKCRKSEEKKEREKLYINKMHEIKERISTNNIDYD